MIRLRALRVAEVGRFQAPVALEGLGDGLNVLAGPNELGKSTLMAALKAVFLAKYDGKSEALRALVPNDGGAPLVEVEFEAEGRLWRARKRFLKTAMAQLVDVQGGATLRNADAQQRLAALLAGPPELERFGLLWVEQGDALADIASDAAGKGLAGLLESEIDAVALDGRARRAQDEVRAALGKLRTSTGRPAVRGVWAEAIAALKGTEAQFGAASQRRAEQQARLDELGRIAAERGQLMDPVARAMRAEALSALRVRLAKAGEAGQQRQVAEQRLAAASARLQAAEQAHGALTRGLAGFAALSTDAAQGVREKDAVTARQVEAVGVVRAVEVAHREQIARAGQLEVALVAARKAEDAALAVGERDRLAERIASARAAETAAAAARGIAVARAAVTAARVADLRRLSRALGEIDAAFEAVVPEVSVALQPGKAGVILIDGQPVADGTVLRPEAPITLDIVGIGRIRIAPNPATLTDEKLAERARRWAEVGQVLAELGVAMLAEAETRLTERQAADGALREAQARLSALAPQGIAHLIELHGTAARAAADFSSDALRVADVVAALEIAKSAAVAAAQPLKLAEQAQAALEAEGARLEATAAARMTQLASLAQQLGTEAEREVKRRAADAGLTEAQVAFREAKSAGDAWMSHPDVGRIDVLADEFGAAERAEAALEVRLGLLDRSMAELEGALRAAGDEDVEGSYARAAARQDEALRAHVEIETDVQALVMLDGAFERIAAAGQSEFSAPLRARIAPYLGLVFPDARLSLGEGLSPALLERGSRAEPHRQLSRGTREQIAVLVRLGLARLLADRGAGVPLLLDDAFAYADDVRIEQMLAALAVAAESFQVLLFTCRGSSVAGLDGRPGVTQLVLRSWVPETVG